MMIDWDISEQVAQALREDCAENDVTAALLPEQTQASGRIITREAMVLCGCAWVEAVFAQIDEHIMLNWQGNDGDHFNAGAEICMIKGPAKGMLAGERTALNFLQTLSATATQTWAYSKALQGTSTQLLDTRKTLPGYRLAQKYAVSCGGGHNHRKNLAEAYLIKENHLASLGGVTAAVAEARAQHPEISLEVEVETLEELTEALELGVDRILLDNFQLAMLEKAVKLNDRRAELEVSGNVTLDNIAEIAKTGVDFISVGALTKHVNAIDLSMQLDLNE